MQLTQGLAWDDTIIVQCGSDTDLANWRALHKANEPRKLAYWYSVRRLCEGHGLVGRVD